jgi:DNA-binding NarL/FixJ family response regulator
MAYPLTNRNHRPERVNRLTARESEILRLVADGRADGDIAQVLHLSESTVKTHLRSVYSKLDVPSRAAAVAVALRSGIID